MSSFNESSRRLSEREAAAYLGAGISARTLQDWRNRGVGPAYHKLGKRVAYETRDLEAFVEARRVEAKAAA